MMRRCYKPHRKDYRHYGLRGIRVWEPWHTFDAFLSDLGLRPSNRHSLDRIDNAKGYFPGNVRWGTPEQQARNKRNSRLVSAFGETLALAEWAARFSLNRGTLKSRLDKGWPPEKAISTPVKDDPAVTAFGKTMTLLEWSKIMPIKYGVLQYRIAHGWPAEKALTAPSQYDE